VTELFASAGGEQLALPGGELVLYRTPHLGADPHALFDELHQALAWREESISLFGKRYLQPRLLAWYGDADARYRYSGVVHDPLPWLPQLADLRARLQDLTGASFNSVLANLYRDHRDSMGLHADDEPELGPRPVIASLSLGEERVFRLRHRHDSSVKPLRLPLPSGSLLVMRGDTQRNWKHEIPKRTKPCGPRINLTFRLVRPGR
jgi:alkylated DNA repair dioxygenase AlkB